jgi:hypothetical protein
MSHQASHNWGNPVNLQKGYFDGHREVSVNAVRLLLSGDESESLRWVRHHRLNATWLNVALRIELDKSVRFPSVRKLIVEMLEQLEVAK